MQSTRFDDDATRRWLNDIHRHIALARKFSEDMVYEAFRNDVLRLYAVIRCLEIISEASRRLPDELKERHPAIPWRGIAASGNVYRHEYEEVAATTVWDTLTYHLEPLRAVVVVELSALDPQV